VAPGVISPRRKVPSSIARPEYVGKAVPTEVRGNDVNDAETIEAIRVAARIAARALVEVGKAVAPGVTTDELDRLGHEYMLDNGAYPSTLGYRGFPKSLCTSVNEVICHGIPDSTVLKDGDIVNCDVTIFLNGVHGDTNATFFVGEVADESARLVEVTRECLEVGIAAVRPGGTVRDIGQAIQAYAEGLGYGVVRSFVGHGIGRTFHAEPQVYHYDNPAARMVLEPGMTFTIEPMITVGDHRHDLWADGWTAVTKDRSRTAQFEHTLAVTDTGSEVLTRLGA